jgi:undecaprenyl-diphosphatase
MDRAQNPGTGKTGEGRFLAVVIWLIPLAVVVCGAQRWLPTLASEHGAGIDRMLAYLLITGGGLIVVGHLLRYEGEKAKTFEIFIQMGAILAVVVYYRTWLWETIAAALRRTSDVLSDVEQARRTLLGIVLAVLPALMAGAALHGFIKRHLFQPWTVAVGLVVGGVAIFAVERWRPKDRTFELGRVTLRQATLIGVGQCFALWPGVSRSAATILSGLCLGLDHPTAAAFSFLLSVPTLAAAAAYDLLKSWHVLSDGDLFPMGIGFIVAFVVAWAVIAGFLRFLRTHSLNLFGGYRLVVGAVILWLKP